MIRSSISDAARRSQTSTSRATIREIDDDHLMQEVKQADVMHSETPSNFERFQMVGLTAVPMKQKEEKQQQKKADSGGKDDGFNHDQPKGEAAEALMLYPNGQRSHPIAIVDDRRVRPYGMKEGESALYSADGSGQMAYHKKDGFYLLTTDTAAEGETQAQERFMSMRHVNKGKQTRKLTKGQKPPEHKHEGDSVNTEVRCTKNRIEFRAGDTVVGYYDKGSETWFLKGKIIEMEAERESHTVTQKFETIGTTRLGLDAKGENGDKVATEGGIAKKTYAKPG